MKKWFVALSVLLLFCACEAQNPISREYRCWFLFSYTDHPTSLLFTAVQNPGSYAYVTTRGDGKKSARHVTVKFNDPSVPLEDNIIRTDLENNLRYDLGANNDIGLIIGCTNFDGPRAYDGSCPNCPTLRAMNWSGNRQQVTCSQCSRTYSLDTGNIISGEEGSSLMRYNCAFDGTTVRAWN